MLKIFAFLMAAHAAPVSLLSYFPAQVLRHEVVEFKPMAGYHFSPQAPQACGSGQLTERSPRAIKCQFETSGQTQAMLNICDDKLTFCRPTPAAIEVRADAGMASSRLTKNETLNRDLHRRLVPGFTEASREEIIKAAATRGQPVFVMISTDWCPPCNEAKEYLLGSSAFRSVSQNWFKVYVDGDSLAAADWEKAVPYQYYPSFVLLNSSMQELGRYNGELRQADFEAWAKETATLDPIARLRERVLARRHGSLRQKIKDLWAGVKPKDKHRDEVRLLRWALDQDDHEVIASLLPGDYPELAPAILRHDIDALEKREASEGVDLKKEKIAKYQELLKATFKGDHWSENLDGLCEADLPSCKEYVGQIPVRQQFMMTREDGLKPNERESALGDELFFLTQVYQTLGDQEQSRKFARECVEHFDAMTKQSVLKISRAGQQGMIACLEMAGDFKREQKVLDQLVHSYPTEPTFMSRYARMLRKQKKYKEALAWIARAEGQAYGYNWFTLQALKIDILLGLKDKSQARQAVSAALAQVSLDGGQDSRNQSLVARLRGLQAKVENSP